ncbi:MAG: lytic transglycosylase domain-containing protein [Deltaproteobacteria bacterium]|nr:lytic transglycosylase domain-containing protein [Deltaproteobacteria bacterium]
MDDKAARHIGAQALSIAFAFALVVFVALATILIYQNFELSRRIDSVIGSQAEIKAQFQELQREVDRLNSFFAPQGIKKMSSRLKKFGHLEDGEANYYAALIYVYSNKNGLDPFLVYSVIQTESNFVQEAVSPKGARGLMQVMPSWSRGFDISPDDLFHPAVNIRVGTSILRDEVRRLRDWQKALAVYNSGRSHGRGKYVEKVMDIYKML